MDADRVFSSGSGHRSEDGGAGLPAPLDGEIILPNAGSRRQAGTPPPADEPVRPSSFTPGSVLIGMIAVALLGVGAAGGYFAWERMREPDPTATALSQMQQDLGTLKSGVATLKTSADIARQDETIRGLKKSVDVLKAELDAARAANAASLAQIGTKLDKADRDPTGKLADIATRLDKLDQNPGPKLNDIAARLDRIERQVSSPQATGSIAPAPRPQVTAQPAAVSAEKPSPPKPAALGNWIVRDVYDGIALVEGRSGGIREVTPGEVLPGAGEVRSIERRGRAWIVVTSRGIIDDSTW